MYEICHVKLKIEETVFFSHFSATVYIVISPSLFFRSGFTAQFQSRTSNREWEFISRDKDYFQ